VVLEHAFPGRYIAFRLAGHRLPCREEICAMEEYGKVSWGTHSTIQDASDIETADWGPMEAVRAGAANMRACREALDSDSSISARDSALVVGSMISAMNSVRGVLINLTAHIDCDPAGLARSRTQAVRHLDELVGKMADMRLELARIAEQEVEPR
jgi:hypothetical protein